MKRVISAMAVGASAFSATAQLDEGDIGLRIENNQIVTFLIAEEEEGLAPATTDEVRLFIGEIGLVEFEPFDPMDPTGGGSDVFQGTTPLTTNFSTNTPGFDSGPGVFTPGERVGFTINNGLQVYDPTTDSLISASLAEAVLGGNGTRGGSERETLAVEFDGVAFQTNFATGVTLPQLLGTPLDMTLGLPVFSDGRWHRHWNFSVLPIDNPGSPTTAMPLADPAVYVVELTMVTTETGIAASKPFYIVFPIGVAETDPEFDAAIDPLSGLLAVPADLAAPFGTLDFNDINAFVSSFLSGS